MALFTKHIKENYYGHKNNSYKTICCNKTSDIPAKMSKLLEDIDSVPYTKPIVA